MGYSHIHNVFGSTFMGLVVRQYWADIALWELFLTEHPEIKSIIELGTFKAGMSLFLLGNALNRGQNFWTFDRDRPIELESPVAQRIGLDLAFVHGDFFEGTRDALVQLLTEERFKPLMLFVDGSNKPREFKEFVPLLSPGDYCAIHDYTTEYKPEDLEPLAGTLEPVFLEQCERIRPCLTRFWRVPDAGT